MLVSGLSGDATVGQHIMSNIIHSTTLDLSEWSLKALFSSHKYVIYASLPRGMTGSGGGGWPTGAQLLQDLCNIIIEA